MKKIIFFALMTLMLSLNAFGTNSNQSDSVAAEKVWDSQKKVSPTWEKTISEAQKNSVSHDKLEQNICKSIEQQTGYKCDGSSNSNSKDNSKSSSGNGSDSSSNSSSSSSYSSNSGSSSSGSSPNSSSSGSDNKSQSSSDSECKSTECNQKKAAEAAQKANEQRDKSK